MPSPPTNPTKAARGFPSSDTAPERAWEFATKATVPIVIAVSGWAVSLNSRLGVAEARLSALPQIPLTTKVDEIGMDVKMLLERVTRIETLVDQAHPSPGGRVR